MTEASIMTIPDGVCLSRLYALVARGYRPMFRHKRQAAEFIGVDLVHPSRSGCNAPPPLTLWSDGSLATSKVLWPQKYVANDDGPPDWQQFILPIEQDRFTTFIESVRLPTIKDLYILPTYLEAKAFVARFLFGASLCILIGSAIKLTQYLA